MKTNKTKVHDGCPRSDRAPIAGALHLVLSFSWFAQLESGQKAIEYRRICPHWERDIWIKRDRIKTVIFREGYTAKTITAKVTKIDIGPCPYEDWDGDFYRIHFVVSNDSSLGTRPETARENTTEQGAALPTATGSDVSAVGSCASLYRCLGGSPPVSDEEIRKRFGGNVMRGVGAYLVDSKGSRCSDVSAVGSCGSLHRGLEGGSHV